MNSAEKSILKMLSISLVNNPTEYETLINEAREEVNSIGSNDLLLSLEIILNEFKSKEPKVIYDIKPIIDCMMNNEYISIEPALTLSWAYDWSMEAISRI